MLLMFRTEGGGRETRHVVGRGAEAYRVGADATMPRKAAADSDG